MSDSELTIQTNENHTIVFPIATTLTPSEINNITISQDVDSDGTTPVYSITDELVFSQHVGPEQGEATGPMQDEGNDELNQLLIVNQQEELAVQVYNKHGSSCLIGRCNNYI